MAATAKKTKQNFSAALREKMDRIARMIGAPVSEIKTLAKRTEEAFRSVGKACKRPGGRIEIHARKNVPLTFTNSKHVTKAKALVKVPVDCGIAKCAKDPDSCWLGAYATSVHVGNATVTFWSELCPHLVVKCMLPKPLRDAIRDWDEQVRKKQKNRRFRLADGTYYLSPYPPSLDPTNNRKPEKIGPRGKNTTKPTRRLTVKSDISLAIAAAVATGKVPRRAAAKRKRKAA